MKLTISEAAAHCGYKSRTVLYRLLRDGLLRDYEADRHGRNRLLESDPPGRCPLREFVASCVQLRHDSPLGQRHGPPGELTDAELGAYCDEHLGDDALAAAMAPIDNWIQGQQQEANWERVALLLTDYLGPAWPGPPWDGDQTATVAMALSLAQEAG
jgi:hypothetical protein